MERRRGKEILFNTIQSVRLVQGDNRFLIPHQAQPQTSPLEISLLINISKIHILLIRQILKSMHIALILGLANARSSGSVTLLVETSQVESEENDDEEEEHVAAHVGAEGDEVARGVGVAEDLGAWEGVVVLVCMREGFGIVVHWDGNG